MNLLKNIADVLRVPPARKLTIRSVILTAVIATIVFLGSMLIVTINEVLLLESTVSSLPEHLEARTAQLQTQYDVYKNDYIARGELAVILYDEYKELETSERLELALKSTNAENVTLLDGQGKVVATTATDKLSPSISGAYAAMNNSSAPLFDSNIKSLDVQEVLDDDGYVPETDSMPMIFNGRTNDGNILMAEFDYTAFGKVIADQKSNIDLCKYALGDMAGYCFMKTEGGEIIGYPFDELSDSDKERLIAKAGECFERQGIVLNLNRKNFATTYTLGILLGQPYLLAKLPSFAFGNEFMLAVPLSRYISSIIMCDLAILVLVVFGYVIFSRYATNSFRLKPNSETEKDLYDKRARRQTRSGVLTMLTVTCVISIMLLTLESMSRVAELTIEQRVIIVDEAEHLAERESELSKEYSKRYTTKARAIARLLSDHPELRNRETLQRLSKATQVEYLMLFDKLGSELFASNTYTGFSVGNERSGSLPEWRPVLQGLEQIETPSKKNKSTGAYERTIATLITDTNGLADGMLVMVVNDDEYTSQVGDSNLEGVVNSYVPRTGQTICVIDNEEGTFLAHTNPEMIGEKAEYYLNTSVFGRDYEGYTNYAGLNVYVSGSSTNGKTLLVVTGNVGMGDLPGSINLCVVAIIVVLLAIFFCPKAATLCSEYAEQRTDVKKPKKGSNPLLLFSLGYGSYLVLLALVTYMGAIYGFWQSFSYVHSGNWAGGIHLFSLWYATFALAVVLFVAEVLHVLIRNMEDGGTSRAKTYARLAQSFITYGLSIFTVIMVLQAFGVDTTAIIGSVSIISIAIGMGAQDLVKDVVAGIFFTFEGTFAVGDIVEIGGWRGRVTNMGIRATEITNESNDVKIINNSRIGDVINLSRVKTLCTEEFELPRTVEPHEVQKLVGKYIERVVKEVPEVADTLEMSELVSISESSYTVRLSYSVNEADRESVTIRLRNTMMILLETGLDNSKVEEDEGKEDED